MPPSINILAIRESPYESASTAFGITEYKGVEILLQAIHLIAPEFRAKMIVEIHSANLESQAAGFQDLIETL